MKNISFTKKELSKFEELYCKAVKNKKKNFEFRKENVETGFARHVIEYYSQKFKKQ